MTSRRSPLFGWRVLILASDLPSNAKLTGLTLSVHMDRNGSRCWPSITTLARETGLSRRAVHYALDQIEQAGLVERVRGGRGKSTRYRATSARGALLHDPQLVHAVHPTSARGAHEDVQEDVKNLYGRANARRKRKGTRAEGAHPDSSYLDEAGSS